MNDFKKRIEAAIHKHHVKQIKTPRRRKQNDKPEARLAMAIRTHLNDRGWSVDIVESKAVYSAAAGRYIRGQLPPGFSDIVGNDGEGRAVYIEVKAKGKRSTLRPDQREFLTDKISTKCFAAVVDSIEYLDLLYSKWTTCFSKDLLINDLPKAPPRHQETLDIFDIE